MVPTRRFPLSFLSTLLGLVLIAEMAFVSSAAAQAQERASHKNAFSRGINLGDYLAYPESETWPIFTGTRAATSDAELKRLAATGLTFIRLPVEPAPFLNRPAEQVAALEQRLKRFIARATDAGLAVMVAGFPRHEIPPWRPEDILEHPEGKAFERYRGFLLRLAAILQSMTGATIALELMNEPQPECSLKPAHDWTQMQKRLYARVRAAAPDLTLVLTPACWSGIDGLETLDMAGYDRNTLVDVHFYEPFSFTHQGAGWTLAELKYLGGLDFPARLTEAAKVREAIARLAVARHPGAKRAQRQAYAMGTRALAAYMRADADEETVARRIGKIAQWADGQGIDRHRIVLGEFGALRSAPDAAIAENGGRARWLAATHKAAESNGFGWGLWAYHSRFGLLANGEDGALDAQMLRALGLTRPGNQSRVNHPMRQAAGMARKP